MSQEDVPTAKYLVLIALLAHMFGIGLTLGSTYPLSSLTLEVWGTPSWLVGLSGAMAPLALLIMMPFLPRLAHRLGAINSMILGCVVGVLGLIIMYIVKDTTAWVFARFMIGAGLALPWLVGDVWINTLASEDQRGRMVSFYVTSLFAGFAVGPFALGEVGIEGVAPFLMGSLALTLAVVPLVLVKKDAPTIVADGGRHVLAEALRYPAAALSAFLAGFTESLIFSLLPVWGLMEGMNDAGTLVLLTICICGGVFLQPFVGILADQVNRRLLLGGIGLVLTLSAGAHLVAPVPLLYIPTFVLGAMVLALYGLALTILGQVCPPWKLAACSAGLLILYQTGSLAGPLVSGVSMDLVGSVGFIMPLLLAGIAVAMTAARKGT